MDSRFPASKHTQSSAPWYHRYKTVWQCMQAQSFQKDCARSIQVNQKEPPCGLRYYREAAQQGLRRYFISHPLGACPTVPDEPGKAGFIRKWSRGAEGSLDAPYPFRQYAGNQNSIDGAADDLWQTLPVPHR